MGICMRIAERQSMAIARAHLAGQPGRAAGINCWGGPPGRPTGISVSLQYFYSKPYQGLRNHTPEPYPPNHTLWFCVRGLQTIPYGFASGGATRPRAWNNLKTCRNQSRNLAKVAESFSQFPVHGSSVPFNFLMLPAGRRWDLYMV